jgi:cell division protein ZipA
MESGILRLILLVVGAGVVLAIYLVGRARTRGEGVRDRDVFFEQGETIDLSEGADPDIPLGIRADETDIPELSDVVLGLKPRPPEPVAEVARESVSAAVRVSATPDVKEPVASEPYDPVSEPVVIARQTVADSKAAQSVDTPAPSRHDEATPTPEFLKSRAATTRRAPEPVYAPEPDAAPVPMSHDEVEEVPSLRAAEPEVAAPPRPVDKLVVMHVHAEREAPFLGPRLLDSFATLGLQLGEMDLFHRPSIKGGTLFSVANLVNPGSFDPNNMSDFQSPGLSLFLRLPTDIGSLEAFEAMLKAARAIVSEMGGELRDEQHNKLTLQAIDYIRSDLQDYDRRALLSR